ncbi:baseplate tail tube cap [Cyanophage S-TIM4]|uniref:Baseplate tail tube cap n=1 Tax=Cyanophage S-TIM4 TaxID=1048189 RepID=A0A345AW67_9CAUD|nr:baseplate tail tube cap [Cyanophage S-TIM4]AXF41150.1 baseplate tail tube cap [Cyanophage S-TIM4]
MATEFLDDGDYGKSTLRYPLQPPVMDQDFNGDSADSLTGKTDYLRIRRKKTVYHDDGGKAYYGQNNYPRNLGQTNYHSSIAYLAIPGGINAQYSPVYNQTNLGIGGMAAINALTSGTQNNFESVAGSLQDAARAVLPEFFASTIASGANALSGFLGVRGNLNMNSLAGLTEGKVFNPYVEQIFSQMNFRNHSFAFKMFARNYKEAQEIKNIIQYVKVGAHPKVGANVSQKSAVLDSVLTDEGNDAKKLENTTGAKDQTSDNFKTFLRDNGGVMAGYRFFGIPDQYELAFMRMNPKSGEFSSASGGIPYADPEAVNQSLTLHFLMDTCVCSGLSVNYTPDNQYTSIKRIDGTMIQVPAVELQVQFTEVRLLSQSDIIRGY